MADDKPYDPNAPENKYPKTRHQYLGRHEETGEHMFKELIVKDPDDEKKRAPSSKGWVDLKRDVIEKVEADEAKSDDSGGGERAASKASA